MRIRVTSQIPDDPPGWLGVTPGRVYEAGAAPDGEILISHDDNGEAVWLYPGEWEAAE